MSKPPAIKDIHHHYAGVFLISPDKRVVCQLRDDKVGIDNPGKAGPFGGAVEAGEEPLDAAWRELVEEETNLKLSKQDIKHLSNKVAFRELTQEWEILHCYYAFLSQEQLDNLEVYEGQGWVYITGKDDPKLSPASKLIATDLFKTLNLHTKN